MFWSSTRAINTRIDKEFKDRGYPVLEEDVHGNYPYTYRDFLKSKHISTHIHHMKKA